MHLNTSASPSPNVIPADSLKRLKQMVQAELSQRRTAERRSASLEAQLNDLYRALERVGQGQALTVEEPVAVYPTLPSIQRARAQLARNLIGRSA